jgi:hypothetical protein
MMNDELKAGCLQFIAQRSRFIVFFGGVARMVVQRRAKPPGF